MEVFQPKTFIWGLTRNSRGNWEIMVSSSTEADLMCYLVSGVASCRRWAAEAEYRRPYRCSQPGEPATRCGVRPEVPRAGKQRIRPLQGWTLPQRNTGCRLPHSGQFRTVTRLQHCVCCFHSFNTPARLSCKQVSTVLSQSFTMFSKYCCQLVEIRIKNNLFPESLKTSDVYHIRVSACKDMMSCFECRLYSEMWL